MTTQMNYSKVGEYLIPEIQLQNTEAKPLGKPYRERQKRTEYPKRDSFRTAICIAIDDCLSKKPKDFEAFLLLMEQSGYEIKRGKHTALRGKGQKRFIRFRSLGDGYTEENIVAAILGKDKKPELIKPQKLNLLIDIQEKIISKGAAYERWATNFNLKSMSKTLLFLRDHKIETVEDLKAMEEEATNKFNDLSAGIKEKEAKMAEMLALKKQIFNYADTREIYIQYRKSGYSKKFFEQNRQAITLHKAAKQAFNECGLEKIPTVKELNVMYHELMSMKKQMYSEYTITQEAVTQYELLCPLLSGIYGELQELSKKKPDTPLNNFKVTTKAARLPQPMSS